MSVHEAINSLPKAELHVHLLGAIRPPTLLEIAMKEEIDAPFETPEDSTQFFKYIDFPHFIEVYGQVIEFIRDEKYFERLAYEMLEDCAGCNTRYVEISFSPSDHVQRGLDYYEMIDAINRGIARANRDFSVQCNIRIDLVRNFGPENGMQVLDWIEQKPDNIISIDIGGSEDKYPAKPFAEVYARAKEMGLHRVAHAGEAAGSESVWQAVKHLDVERIGHGVTARNDQQLLQVLQEKGIAIEACPVSNVRTRVVESIGDHPIREYFDKGLLVTVNSDDPSFFHTSMDNEYIQLGKHLGFRIEDLFQLSLNAIEASFLSSKSKDKMRDAFHREYGRII